MLKSLEFVQNLESIPLPFEDQVNKALISYYLEKYTFKVEGNDLEEALKDIDMVFKYTKYTDTDYLKKFVNGNKHLLERVVALTGGLFPEPPEAEVYYVKDKEKYLEKLTPEHIFKGGSRVNLQKLQNEEGKFERVDFMKHKTAVAYNSNPNDPLSILHGKYIDLENTSSDSYEKLANDILANSECTCGNDPCTCGANTVEYRKENINAAIFKEKWEKFSSGFTANTVVEFFDDGQYLGKF
jgi:hypothetical protein